MTPIQRAQRIKVVIERDGPLCVWCSTRLSAKHRDATLDHALPYANDGSNRPLNLLLSCGSCNWRRGTMELDHFATKMEKGGFTVQRTLIEDAEARLTLEPLALRSACATASGAIPTLKVAPARKRPAKQGVTCRPGLKTATTAKAKPQRRRPVKTIKEVIDVRPALGRLGIDFAEELAWAYAA